jgi:predicted neutral ceramidase superfamily lipid hydrolase
VKGGLDFYTLDILTMFIDLHRKEFHACAQEFDDYSRKETDGMVDAITCALIPMMYDEAAESRGGKGQP